MYNCSNMSAILSDKLAFETVAEAFRGRYKMVLPFESSLVFSTPEEQKEKLLKHTVHFGRCIQCWILFARENILSVCRNSLESLLSWDPTTRIAKRNQDRDLEMFVGAKDLYSLLASEEGGDDPGILWKTETYRGYGSWAAESALCRRWDLHISPTFTPSRGRISGLLHFSYQKQQGK